MHKKRAVIYLTILYIALITILSLIPISSSTALNIPHQDKFIHILFYLGLNILLLLSIANNSKYRCSITNVALVTLASILYSVAIEYLQPYIGRNYDVGDIIANSVGAILGALLFLIFKYLFRIDEVDKTTTTK